MGDKGDKEKVPGMLKTSLDKKHKKYIKVAGKTTAIVAKVVFKNVSLRTYLNLLCLKERSQRH